jgi:hypothetical protein
VRAVALVSIIAVGGCVRDPAEAICPPIGAGDLVVTELRGPQSPDDSLGPWIELYNASNAAIDLDGIKVRFGDGQTYTMGSTDYDDFLAILVRRSLTVTAGTYVVLGMFEDTRAPAHVDYGFVLDFHVPWPAKAVIGVESCGVEIDHMDYESLEDTGSYSFGGAPDADANDLRARWCSDKTAVSSTFPGTPRAPNKACP